VIHRLIKLVNFTAQKKDVIIDGKKSVAWGQCAGVVGGRRVALGVGHRGKGGGGREWGQGFRLEHLQTQQHYCGGARMVGVHGVVRGGGGKAVLG
jgi:hypothetical protein